MIINLQKWEKLLHEFCHLKYKTHGKNFYKLIEKYIPNYKEIEVQIKGMF